jgi:cytochrome b subunit of formate dehydrogenase
MTPKPSFRVTLVSSLLLGALSLTGCWRRHPQQSQRPIESVLPPRAAEHVEADPEKIRIALKSSVHAKLDCTGCHGAGDKRDPTREIGKGQCASCHEKESAAYAETVHAKAVSKGKEAATCEDCHGIHEVRAVGDPESLVSPRNTPATCGKCHENPGTAEKLGIKKPLAVRQYVESIHGRALLVQGLLVAPACADCHGKAHSIFEASDARSSVNQKNVAATCGRCHAGELEKYRNSVHAKALGDEIAASTSGQPLAARPEVADGKKAPSCPTCHSAHEITERGPKFRLASDKICGDCHKERLHRYLETYHGRAHDLGDVEVAACYSCHGAHDVWSSTNAASTLSDQNRQATCQQCHPGVSKNFSRYLAHADHSDREHYPTLYWAFLGMTGLLVGTFGFFGIHSLLWLGRTIVLKVRDPKGFREAKERARKEEGAKLYSRFRPIDRFVHFLVIVSFLLLVTTGMPLKFHTARWSHAFFDAIGGAAIARSTHRFAAIVTLSYFVLHVGSLMVLLVRHKHAWRDEEGKFSVRRFLGLAFGPDSPFPRPQDAKDVAAHLKWFFGRGPRPKFDRFTYWEKFDYIAVFWGVTVIGLSGLIMWIPETFTRVLPGWSINVAHIVHSDEALLAAGFIFTFHFFNSHFRPEKFPFDPVMFSGHITEEELRHERPALYERMSKDGGLERYKTAGEWLDWKPIMTVFGGFAIALGLALSALIFWALLR